MKKIALGLAALSCFLLTAAMTFTPLRQQLALWQIQADSIFLNLPAVPYNYANPALPGYFNAPGNVGADNQPPANQITDAGATLGRVLFYDVSLSQNYSLSCASCHVQELGFSDTSAFSKGFMGGFTGRNSMGLTQARYYATGHFFWDERANTLEDQVLMPVQDAVEMGMTLDSVVARVAANDLYAPLFADAFGNATVTEDRISRALSQFVRSMVSYQSKYDAGKQMVPPGPPGSVPFPNFTAAENLGMSLFFDPQRTGCAGCHGTDHFIAPGPRNNGLDLNPIDLGLGGVTGLPTDNGRFKVNSLRNVAVNPPFMHDGRFQTLEEVIEHYNSGVQNHPNLDPPLRLPNGQVRRLNLTQEEKDGMLAFLHTLTDTVFLHDPKWSNPWDTVQVFSTALSPESLGWEISLYPNPAGEELHIHWQIPGTVSATMTLLDMRGAVVKQWQAEGPQAVDMSELPAGIYLVRLSAQGQHLYRRVVKQ